MTFERQSIGHLSAGNLGHLSENENKLRTFQQNKKSPDIIYYRQRRDGIRDSSMPI